MSRRQELIESTLEDIRIQHRNLDHRSKVIGRQIKNKVMMEGKALAALALQGSINQLNTCSPEQFTDKAALAIATGILEEMQEQIAL